MNPQEIAPQTLPKKSYSQNKHVIFYRPKSQYRVLEGSGVKISCAIVFLGAKNPRDKIFGPVSEGFRHEIGDFQKISKSDFFWRNFSWKNPIFSRVSKKWFGEPIFSPPGVFGCEKSIGVGISASWPSYTPLPETGPYKKTVFLILKIFSWGLTQN